MAARRQYTYRRRVPQGERNMDPEQNATDGIEEEERRELPEVVAPQRNNDDSTRESLTQMIEAMTQMIRNPQAQSSGSGSGSRPMDKNLKLFQDMKPPLFASGGPIEAEDWLMRIEKILEGMACSEDRKVALATYAFDGEAERWWRSQLQGTFGGRSSSQVTWEEFVKVFRDWYVPMTARRQMQDRFNRLIQGDRSVSQYEAEFTMLSRYAPHLIPDDEEKCHRFLSGLKDMIRQPLIPFGIEDYSVLVDRARRIEMDMQATQKRRDFQKRKMEGRSKPSQFTQPSQSGVSTWKKPRSSTSDSSASTATACSKCGRMHKGECLSGTNTCFWCHQPGHMAKSCPLLGQGQRSATEVRPGNYNQRSAGRPRAVESTASGPSQGQTRQNVQPRVYGLSQQEAKGSPDVVTGDKTEQ